MNRILPLLLGSVFIAGCSWMMIKEHPEIWISERDYIQIETADSTFNTEKIFELPDYGMSVMVFALHRRGHNYKVDSNKLAIFLRVSPKKVEEDIEFKPDRIVAVLGPDTLTYVKQQKVSYSGRNFCDYRVSFQLRHAGEMRDQLHPKPQPCTFDLRKSLAYKGQWLDLGVISGKLPD